MLFNKPRFYRIKPARKTIECFDGTICSDNNMPVRVRTVKEFVVKLTEETQQKDAEITNLKKDLESIDSLRDELDVARLTLEQADLTKEKLRNEVAQLKQKLSDERQKNRQLKEQINDLKLKKILKDNKVKQTRKGKK